MLVPYLARKILPADPKDRHLRLVPNPQREREENPVSPRTMAIGLLVALGVGASVYGIAKVAGGKPAPKAKPKGPGGGGEVIIPLGDEPTPGSRTTKPKGNYAGGTTPGGMPWQWDDIRRFPNEASLGQALNRLGYYVGNYDAPGFTMVQALPMEKTRQFQLDYNVVQSKLAPDWPKISVDNVPIGNNKLGALMGNQTIGALGQALDEVEAKGDELPAADPWGYIVNNARQQP